MRLLPNNNNERKHMSDFTWSYSSLKQYQNCPKQYYEIRVLKNYLIMCWWVDEMLANGFNLRGRIVQHNREQCLAYTN